MEISILSYLKFVLFVFVIALLARLREICDFEGWFNRSIFAKIKNQFWYKWFRSHAIDKHTHIEFTVPIINYRVRFHSHPIMYDGYHNFKNIFVAIVIIYSGWHIGPIGIGIGFIVWYYVQKYTIEILVKDGRQL